MASPEVTNQRIGAPELQPTDPRLEYVSAGWFPWLNTIYGSVNRQLPWPFDDLTYAFGDDIYDRMTWDSQVSANLHILKCGILSQEPRAASAVDTDDPRAEYADEIAAFFGRCLRRLKGLRTRTLYNMLDCLMTGNKIAERTYEPARDEIGRNGQPLLVIKRLAVKPRRALQFVVDPYLNVLGFRVSVSGREPGNALNASIEIPPAKCSVLAHGVTNEDPRGTSLGRNVYEPWFGKMQVWPEFLKYLAQFSSRSLVGKTPQGAAPVQVLGPDGNPLLVDGVPKIVNAADLMRDALATLRNGGVAVFPFGSEVIPVDPSGNGEPFLNAFRWFDEQITIAMLGQALATMEGEHQSRAASQVHQDALQTRIQIGKTLVEEMLWELADDLRARNFPNSEGLTPTISLGDVGPQDMVGMMQAVAMLEKAGYIAPSQRAPIDAILGLPIREPDEEDAPPAAPDDASDDDDDMTAAFWAWRGYRPVRPARAARARFGRARRDMRAVGSRWRAAAAEMIRGRR